MRELDLYSDAPSDKPPATDGRRVLDLYDTGAPAPEPAGMSTGRTAPGERPEDRPQDWISDLWRGFSPAVRERFEPRQVIGEGGMGVVIEAFDRLMHRVVAIKGPRDPRHMSVTSRERQVKEAQIAARLTHSNILPVFDLWTDARGNSWCSMLRVPGEAPTLGTRLARLEGTPIDKRPLARLLRTFLEICRAVHYAHDMGFLHRDLKPENVFLAEGAETLALVADWGVAIEKDVAKRGAVDRVGTRGYAAPEQLGLLGDARCDERSDVYSLGILLYEMVVGRRFIRGSSVGSSSSSEPAEAPPPPPIPDLVPRELASIIRRATAWEPEARHPDVSALIGEVDTYQQGGLLDGLEYDTQERLAKWASAHPWTAGAAATGLVAGIVLAVLAWMLWHRSTWLCKRLAIIYAEKAAAARTAHDTDLANHYAALALATWPQKYVMPTATAYTTLAESGQRGRHLWSRQLAAPSSCVAYAPDGRRIAVAGADGPIEVWDAKTARRVARLDGHTRTVRALAFNAAGLLASAGDDGQVRVWERTGPTEWRSRPPLAGHRGSVHSLAFSPDGDVITTAADDGKLRIWRLDVAVARLAPIKMETAGAGSLALDANRNKLFVAARDGSMPMLDIRTRVRVGDITPCHGGLRLITYIPSGGGADAKRLVAFSGTEPDTCTVVRLWDLTFWREFGAMHHERRVTGIHLTPDGTQLVSASEDGAVRVWEIESRKVVLEMTGHRGAVSAVAISPDGRLLASVGVDGSLRLWDIQTGARRLGLEKPLHARSHYVWSPGGRHVFGLPRDAGDVTVWSAGTRAPVSTQSTGGMHFTTAPVVAADGARFAAMAGRRLMVYEMKKCDPPRLELLGGTEPAGDVRALGFDRGGRVLVGIATASTLRIYDLADGRTRTELFWPRTGPRKAPEIPRAIVIGTGAARVAAIDAAGGAWIWIPATQGRDPERVPTSSPATALAFPAGGDPLAIGEESGEVMLWRPRRPRMVRLDAHRAPVESLAFSSDGRQLVSAAATKVAKLWDLAAWEDPQRALRLLRFTSPFEGDADSLIPKRKLEDAIPPWFPPDYAFPEVGR